MAVTDPAGNTFRFGYTDRRLTTITYPDEDEDPTNDPKANLHYSDFPAEDLNNGGDRGNLTKLVDPRGNALSWSYDETGRAVMTSGPEGSKRLSLTYETPDRTVILNSKNEASTYSYDDATKTLTIDGPGCTSCSRSTVKRYNRAGKLIEKVDGEGNITRYENFDLNGNAGTVIEAAGTTDEKITHYTYHSRFNRITAEIQRGAEDIEDRETRYTYDETTGDILSVTRNGYSRGTLQSFTTQYTYNDRDQITEIDGPRTDVADVMTFTYDPVTGYKTGMTQALAGSSAYTAYDALGYPGAIIDPNGNETRTTYDYKGRITRSVSPEGAVTDYTYDAKGNLVSTTMPEGNSAPS
jgi:YD repeat-containing protein